MIRAQLPADRIRALAVQGAARTRSGDVMTTAALVSAITVTSRVVGFLRWLVFSAAVGATCVGSAYAVANQLPNVIYEVAAGGALAAVVVPLVVSAMADGGQHQAGQVASALLGWSLVALTPLAILVAVFADPIVAALAHAQGGGHSEACAQQHQLAVDMLRIFAPQVVLYGVGAVLAGTLQAAHRFIWAAAAPLLSSLVVIATYLGYAAMGGAGSVGGLQLLAWGTTAGVVALTVPLLLPVVRSGIPLRMSLRWDRQVRRRAMALAAAGLIALLAQQFFMIVVLRLASTAGGIGALNVYQYAQAVSLLPYAVFAVPITTTLFPRLARRAHHRENPAVFAQLVARSTRLALLAGLLGAAVVIATSGAVAALFTQLDRGSVQGIQAALLASAAGIAGLAVTMHIARVLYAAARRRAAAGATALGWVSAAFLAATAVIGWRLTGAAVVLALCIAGSIGMVISALVSIVVVRLAIGAPACAGLVRTAAVSLIGSALAAAAGYWLAAKIMVLLNTGLATSVIAGAVALASCIVILGATIMVGDPTAVMGVSAADASPDSPSPHSESDQTWDTVPVDDLGGQGGGINPQATVMPLSDFELSTMTTRAPSVLMVVATSSGGVGRHVQALSGGLVGRGVEVRVAAPAETIDHFIATTSGVSTTEVDIATRPHPLHDLRTVRRLRSLARGVSVVHAHGLRAGALAVMACARHAPVVVTLHNAVVSGGWIRAVYRVLEFVAARANLVAVVSNDLGLRMRDIGAQRVELAIVPAPGAAAIQMTRMVLQGGHIPATHQAPDLLISGVRRPKWPDQSDADSAESTDTFSANDEVVALPDTDAAVADSATSDSAGLADASETVTSEANSAAEPSDSNDAPADPAAPTAAKDMLETIEQATPGSLHLEQRAMLRHQLGVLPGEALLVTAARLAPQKGLRLLLDALRILIHEPSWGTFSGLRCVIAGDGPMHEELADAIVAGALPVELLGRRDDVPQLLQASDIVVVPSRWEGQPLVVQEALAAGAAIVATDVGGTSQVTSDAAILVPGGDIQALATAISRVLADDDLRAQLQQRAIARALDLPTDEDAVTQVLGWYQEISGPRW